MILSLLMDELLMKEKTLLMDMPYSLEKLTRTIHTTKATARFILEMPGSPLENTTVATAEYSWR